MPPFSPRRSSLPSRKPTGRPARNQAGESQTRRETDCNPYECELCSLSNEKPPDVAALGTQGLSDAQLMIALPQGDIDDSVYAHYGQQKRQGRKYCNECGDKPMRRQRLGG